LISTGRHANTSQPGLGAMAVKTEKNGVIIVNDHMETSTKNIYVAGDYSIMPQLV